MKKGKCLSILAIALAAVMGFIPLHILQVTELKEGNPLLAFLIHQGDEFSLGYIHSVELSRVWDSFKVDESYRIILYKTEFRSLNAGLPSVLSPGEKLNRQGDQLSVSGMNRILPSIDLRVHERTDNILKIQSDELLKLHPIAGNTLLRIDIRKVFFWEYVFMKLRVTLSSNIP